MNRKGFTLIELIATIALLAVIAVISFVSINKVVEKNKINNCKTLVDNIITATNEYVSDNRYDNEFIDNGNRYIKEINAQKLLDENYLKGPIVDPFNKTEISGSEIGITIYLNRDYTMLEAIVNKPDNFKDYCNTVPMQSPPDVNYDNPTPDTGDTEAPTIDYNLKEEKYYEEKTLIITSSDNKGVDYMRVEVYKIENGVSTKINNKGIEHISSSTYEVYLDEGKWRIVTTAVDFSGNTGNNDKTYEIDSLIATPTIDNPTGGNWTNSDFALTLHTTSPNITYWQYTYNENATKTGTNNATNWVTYSNSANSDFTTPNFSAEMNRLVYVRACNTKKCSDKASTYIRIDKTAPKIKYSVSGATAYAATNAAAAYPSPITVTISVSDANSGVDHMDIYFEAYPYLGAQIYVPEKSGRVSGTSTSYYLDYGMWGIRSKAYDNAGNMQNQAPSIGQGDDYWTYQQYTIAPNPNAGGGGGGYSGGGCSGSCSFKIDNGYSGGSTICNGHKTAPNEGGCVCVGCGTQSRLW